MTLLSSDAYTVGRTLPARGTKADVGPVAVSDVLYAGERL